MLYKGRRVTSYHIWGSILNFKKRVCHMGNSVYIVYFKVHWLLWLWWELVVLALLLLNFWSDFTLLSASSASYTSNHWLLNCVKIVTKTYLCCCQWCWWSLVIVFLVCGLLYQVFDSDRNTLANEIGGKKCT